MTNSIPKEVYEHIFSEISEVEKLAKQGIDRFMALCLSKRGWRIIQMHRGVIYT